jgi:hypothetical protein
MAGEPPEEAVLAPDSGWIDGGFPSLPSDQGIVAVIYVIIQVEPFAPPPPHLLPPSLLPLQPSTSPKPRVGLPLVWACNPHSCAEFVDVPLLPRFLLRRLCDILQGLLLNAIPPIFVRNQAKRLFATFIHRFKAFVDLSYHSPVYCQANTATLRNPC